MGRGPRLRAEGQAPVAARTAALPAARRAWLTPAAVFFVALVIRLLYLAQVRGTPITDLLLIDAETYDRFARAIRAGQFRGEDVYAVNVLYPYFLAALYTLGKGSVVFALAAQAALDAATCALTAWIGARLFSPSVGLVAGLMTAVAGSMVFYAGALLTPTLVTALGMTTIAALVLWQADPRARWAALGGLALGLATLARGNSLLLLPLAWSCFAAPHASKDGTDRAAPGRAWLVFAACALAPLVLVTARNFAVAGQWVPVSANYAAFYIGHNDQATGIYALPRWAASGEYAHEVWGVRDALARELGRPLTLGEAARWLFDEGVRWAFTHPARELALLGTKLRYFMNAIDAPTNLSPYFARAWSPLLSVLPVGFGLFVPMGLLGAWWARGRARWPLHAWLLVALATALLFFVSAEYRLPALPVLALFTAYGIAVLARDLFPRGSAPAGRRRRLLELALGLPLAAGLAFARPPALTAQSEIYADYAKFGTLAARRGDLVEARALFERATTLAPNYRPGWQGLAAVLERSGDAQGALAAAQRVGGDAVLADSGLAAAARFQRGDVAGALAELTRLEAAARAAGDTALAISLLNNVGLCQFRLGQLEDAASAFEQVIAARPRALKAHYNLGRVRAAQGRIAEARNEFHAALALDPRAPGVREALRALDGAPDSGP
ncbi:MAG: tetratricopeptide repeat protein [Candidatus Eisenbacteria bacterium]